MAWEWGGVLTDGYCSSRFRHLSQLQLKSINFSPDSAPDGELGKKNETKLRNWWVRNLDKGMKILIEKEVAK
ncbi:uncharacterized protein TNCV_679411 [Trichonephila clavipes]|uniref:Uncharacterized protein n=1 Tax=Trichonephila clavata TaxID=2740835 RepID=A0A8X6LPR5_TRICU|nr:uncharacterized protein TNCT_396591 [Trichonephila clavata]GFV28253.1 uncharacterized protein TNCV_679411 [Trichonephila clavipes]